MNYCKPCGEAFPTLYRFNEHMKAKQPNASFRVGPPMLEDACPVGAKGDMCATCEWLGCCQVLARLGDRKCPLK